MIFFGQMDNKFYLFIYFIFFFLGWGGGGGGLGLGAWGLVGEGVGLNDFFVPKNPNLYNVVALLFYVHGKHLRSCRDGQLT